MNASLPLVVLYLSERCNSRCVTCDYWRNGARDMSLETVRQLLPALEGLRTGVVLVSGGEPLLNRDWASIAELLKSRGLALWLLTSGLALAKHADRIAELFAAVTVSLDGTCRATYAAIRGIDAFDRVCDGIHAVAARGMQVDIRVTLQRRNYTELPLFVGLARSLGATRVSFLAVDVANPHAFARSSSSTLELALGADDIPVLDDLLDQLEHSRAAELASGFIAESPAKLRRIRDYFAALLGRGAFPPVRCNAPEFSAVVGADGRVAPCFFIDGPSAVPRAPALREALDSEPMQALRDTIRSGARSECERCVCSMWRDPETLSANRFLSARFGHA